MFDFEYLGYLTEAGGDGNHAVAVRMAKEDRAFTKLRHIWEDQVLQRKAKLKLFQSGVISVLIYSSEVWKLTDKLMRTLRGWAARKLARITGKSVREEYHEPTFDLVKKLRVSRLRWVGHVLRKEETSYDRRALLTLKQPYPPGSALMDVADKTIQELVNMALDRDGWRVLVAMLNRKINVV